ncbi:MAG TPA: pitrilysin family protein [Nocardioidaceae bacterium]|nr:pitrilysin family protein [Nocardioidaceae bacterium]
MTVTTAPSVAVADGWRFPSAVEDVLPNGLRMLAYHCPGQYVVSTSLLFDVPLTVEARELEGVAALTGRTLTQGAAGRSAEDFADALAVCGADLVAGVTPDAFAVRLSAPATRLDPALGLLCDAVQSATFDTNEFEHEKSLRLQEIEQARAYPQHVAVERLNAALFGEARVARPSGGDTDSVAAVGRDDVIAYAERYLHPHRATLVIAGDFADIDPFALAERTLGGWSRDGDVAACTEPPQFSRRPQLILVDFPEATQSTIRVGGPGVTRADERWAAMFVANHAVGGSFSSRINTVLREQKGVTYGASSSLDTGRGAGVLAVSTAVRSGATAESIADIVAILRDANGSLTDEEVTTGVHAAADSAALGFERADAVVGRVELLLSQGLPLDHVDVNLARIRAVTTGAANDAYAEIVRPDELTIVVVGDAASLGDSLAAIGYADVELITPE